MRPLKKILILSANPKDTARKRFDEQVREITEGLRRSKYRDQFEIESIWAVRRRDLRRTLLDYEPHIVHFCGYGDENGLKLEDDVGNAKLVPPDALAELFELFAAKIECVLLNVCYSATQAEAIKKHIDHVIGLRGKIKDKSAIEFALGFYDAIGAGKSYEEAFKFARNAIISESKKSWIFSMILFLGMALIILLILLSPLLTTFQERVHEAGKSIEHLEPVKEKLEKNSHQINIKLQFDVPSELKQLDFAIEKKILFFIEKGFKEKGLMMAEGDAASDYKLEGMIRLKNWQRTPYYAILIKAENLKITSKGGSSLLFDTFDNLSNNNGAVVSQKIDEAFESSLEDWGAVMKSRGIFNFPDEKEFKKRSKK